MTASVADARDRGAEGFRALTKTLGYGWSVAVAAAPSAGRPLMETWFNSHDRDVRRIMRENCLELLGRS